MKKKEVIYQVFTRLFGAKGKNAVQWGTKGQNSVGKFSDFTDQALKEIVIEPISTTIDLHKQILDTEVMQKGSYDIRWLETKLLNNK